jgi:hypothetical protein
LHQIQDLTMLGRLRTKDQEKSKKLYELHVKTLHMSYTVDVMDTKDTQDLL